ncbi:MFS transporter [Candidatus Finniella inopinata]|uniref:MFS transporter n=1 Tax=Candidatus Finniella inopinata TaxID=1696036 RepID=A0A4Q7DJL5_9PROT|nr:MFS transporter [Candidatus Finniella inopinata]RZI46528.1 MFS transporter [Candidatus Finniella inopinata]
MRQPPVDPNNTSAKTLQPIPQTVWTLGWMMFLINLSYVMIYSFSGIYLKTLLGVSLGLIGLLEGLAEASSFAMKLLSGMFSDYLRRRKPVMVFGYMLSVFSRPILAMSSSFALVLTARIMERLGNGIQATPRDAMVADVAPPKRIGASYGLKRSLATAGSFFGGVCGILAMIATGDNYQMVFWIASIPAVIAFSILLFVVKEPKKFDHPAVSAEAPMPAPKRRQRIKLSQFPLLGQSFWLLMAVNAIFMLSRMGETFLILHAHTTFELKITYAPVIMMLFNAGWCAASYPVGVVADRMNRYWFLAIGIIFIVLADLILASATSLGIMFIGVAFWGIQYGITQNIFISLIAETVPEDLRGTGFGCYYIISAISALACDTCAGSIAHHYGEARVFIASGIVALMSLLALILIMGYKKRTNFSKSY